MVRAEALAHLGQMSLKSSILIRPAGLSPMDTSKKTMGRPSVPAPGNALPEDAIFAWYGEDGEEEDGGQRGRRRR